MNEALSFNIVDIEQSIPLHPTVTTQALRMTVTPPMASKDHNVPL